MKKALVIQVTNYEYDRTYWKVIDAETLQQVEEFGEPRIKYNEFPIGWEPVDVEDLRWHCTEGYIDEYELDEYRKNGYIIRPMMHDYEKLVNIVFCGELSDGEIQAHWDVMTPTDYKTELADDCLDEYPYNGDKSALIEYVSNFDSDEDSYEDMFRFIRPEIEIINYITIGV